jgi:hypothetical protein
MAKTIAEIEAEIDAKKAEYSELSNLNSPSLVARWKMWRYIIAFFTNYIWQLTDAFKLEIEDIIKKGVAGRGDWYITKAYEFQYGDSLTVIDNVLQYATPDPDKRIIKRASYFNDTSVNPPVIKLRVATEDVEGNIVGLGSPQLTAFTDYINSIMFAGTRIDIISQATDLLKLIATIYYNPLFDLESLKVKVEAAIKGYLKNLPFDGQVKTSALIDAIQKVEGVSDVVVSTIQAKANMGSYANVVRVYNTVAGYIQIDEANFPLSTTLTYIPE